MRLRVGNRVRKTRGFRFEGTVVAVFRTRSGLIRMVVEHQDGWLKIFSPAEVEVV